MILLKYKLSNSEHRTGKSRRVQTAWTYDAGRTSKIFFHAMKTIVFSSPIPSLPLFIMLEQY